MFDVSGGGGGGSSYGGGCIPGTYFTIAGKEIASVGMSKWFDLKVNPFGLSRSRHIF